MKRFLSLLICVALTLSVLPQVSFLASAAESGTCGDNLTWTLDDSGVLTISGEGTMSYSTGNPPWKASKSKILKVVIGDGVKNIALYAFMDCIHLTEVIIPDSVKEIAPDAFENCVELESVTLPEKLEVLDVGAFQGCTSLTAISIPGSLKTIAGYAFYKCTSLKSVDIKAGVEKIDAAAFCDCSALESVVISDGVTSVGTSAFKNCTKLKNVTLPDSVTDIWYQAFEETAYYNDESNWEDGVLYIGNHLIEAKDGTDTANIKEGTVSLAYSAFANCGLKRVTFPSSLKSIGVSAFVNCGFTELVLPDHITSIGDNAFVRCSSLEKLTIPNSVVSIGDNTFNECEKLVFVCELDSYAHQYAVDNEIPYISITGSGSCGENAKWVLYDNGNLEISGSGAMYNYTEQNKAPWCDMTSNIEKVIIGDGITTVGDYTFSHCEALKTVETAKSIVSIGKYAFYQCVALKTVKTSAYITKIEDHAFCNCNFMEDLLFYDTYDIGIRSFPDTLTSIGEYAFFGCWYLDEVKIPSNVESIGDAAFNDNSAYITVNENNTNYSSYSGALCNKDKTVLISAGGVKDGFVIDSTINTITTGAFLRNYNLTYVTFVVDSTRDTLINIEGAAFYGCSALRSISIPKGVKYIGYYAFQNCEALETIEIPESVTTIEEDAFAECPLLVISCYKDSYAHTYAVENNIQYTLKNNSSGGGGGGGGSSKPKPTEAQKPKDENKGISNFKPVNKHDENTFIDVKKDAWYSDSVKNAYELDLVKGGSGGKFNPTGNMTIAEAITLVARIHSIYNTGKSEFVQGDVWYQVYVDYAIKNGIIAEGRFADFNKAANRVEFAEIFAKAIPETDFNAINNVEKGKIPDVAESDAVYLLYNAGILAGSDDAHSFKPESNIQRSEVATIVTRIVDKEKRVTFEIE